jgi:hypothetical protein
MGRIFQSPPIDAELLRENIELHRRGYFGGTSMRPYLPEIEELCRRYRARSLLDYGSGKGTLWADPNLSPGLRHIDVTLYDPAVEAFEALPAAAFDGVICMDVLEHIREAHLPGTLGAIISRAQRFVLLAICIRAGTKRLPFANEDVHVTVRPRQWWEALIAAHCTREGVDTQARYSE